MSIEEDIKAGKEITLENHNFLLDKTCSKTKVYKCKKCNNEGFPCRSIVFMETCFHYSCVDCLRRHVRSEMDKGGYAAKNLLCTHPKCKNKLTQRVIKFAIGSGKEFARYQELISSEDAFGEDDDLVDEKVDGEQIFRKPRHWQPQSKDFQLFTLSTSSNEYNFVYKEFIRGLPNCYVSTIQRVQSRSIFEKYQLAKARISRNSKFHGYKIEQFLFHGTAAQNAILIAQQSFDWRLSGIHGASLGNGNYFATSSSYSHSYSTVGSEGKRKMFFAKVLVGRYCVGSGGLKRPPAIDNRNPAILYDSVVNTLYSPTMFVTFENDQAYPAYMITYSDSFNNFFENDY